jgi:hypothetical protein
MSRKHTRRSLSERFWEKVQQSDGCWEWTGWRTPKGYGALSVGGKKVRAHRFAYELCVGPIPPTLIICHHCDNPACVRPDHLFCGTYADNNRDMLQKGRGATGDRNGARTHPERMKLFRPRKREKQPRRQRPRKGLARGERNGSAKLTADQVREIRQRHATGDIGYIRLATLFGVGVSTVRRIVHRSKWRHIE